MSGARDVKHDLCMQRPGPELPSLLGLECLERRHLHHQQVGHQRGIDDAAFRFKLPANDAGTDFSAQGSERRLSATRDNASGRQLKQAHFAFATSLNNSTVRCRVR